MKPFYEVVAARTYYGRHATGAVLLRNGYPEYHGSWAEARRTLKLAQEGWFQSALPVRSGNCHRT